MLGLERLITGRDCNGFDRLSPARKARAFAELIRLGYVYGNVEDVTGQNYPKVSIRRVSSRGRRMRNKSLSVGDSRQGRGMTIFWVFLAIAAALFGCLFVMFKARGG